MTKVRPVRSAIVPVQLIVNSIRFEFPVRFGFVTLTGTTPALLTKNDGIVTTIVFPVTDVGNNTAVPKFTTAPTTKSEPEMVNVNVCAPAVTAAGAKPATVRGTGAVYGATVNDMRVGETPPPGWRLVA